MPSPKSTTDEKAKALPLASFTGLTASEAAIRLEKHGPNELPRNELRSPFRIVFEVLKEPMLALLLGGGLIYLALGDRAEAMILLAFALLSVLITVVQEVRTERVLEALRDLTSPRALVIRGGEHVRIAGRDVVPGDIVLLAEGDRVPADAKLIQAHDLMSDESLLTGESVPVRKSASASQKDAAAVENERRPFVFAGSLVVRGTATAEVTETGANSEIGKIGQSLASLETQVPRLAAATRKTVLFFAFFGALISLAAVLLNVAIFGDWLNASLAGIALGMSMMPEEFPVVLTVFMAMGAWRISQARVLTRKASSIETLGSATVLCTDKTGTLTENRMMVAEVRLPKGGVWRPDNSKPATKQVQDIALLGKLASARDAFDPMDTAFHLFAEHIGNRVEANEPELKKTYGLRPDLLAFVQVWHSGKKAATVAAKGAPEAIAKLCKMSKAEQKAMAAEIDIMAKEGLRVLGVAKAAHASGDLPHASTGFDFEFMGLIGLADPLRKSAPKAVRECRSAGIRVIMITGDYPETARTIARQAGIEADTVLTGPQMAELDDAALSDALKTCNVFARIMPAQKLKLVEVLKAQGEVVAMTGDGVNDAPSLKAAHIGVAMGGRGTDVAREASSIVLLDDDFGSIVKAVRLGRRIYDNLQKAIGFIFAVHVPIAGLALLPLLFGFPPLFGPVHIAFLEMVIDPVCSLVFESEGEEKNVMSRPPRKPDAPLFSLQLVSWSIAQGALGFAFVAAIYLYSLYQGLPQDEVRSLAFFSLVFTIMGLIFVNRSFSASLRSAFMRKNAAIPYVLILVPAMLAVTLLVPAVNQLFGFGQLHWQDIAISVGAGFLTLLVLEALKAFFFKSSRRPIHLFSK